MKAGAFSVSKGLTSGDVVRTVYSGPSAELLQRRVSEGYVFGEVRVSDFDLKRFSDTDAFVYLLKARITATLDDMAERLCIQALPVHDEPGEVCDVSWHYAGTSA